jgi:hypothetical protein
MTSFASVDRLLDDAWIAIASFLTHDELRQLSLTSHHIGDIAVSNAVWEWLPQRDFSAPVVYAAAQPPLCWIPAGGLPHATRARQFMHFYYRLLRTAPLSHAQPEPARATSAIADHRAAVHGPQHFTAAQATPPLLDADIIQRMKDVDSFYTTPPPQSALAHVRAILTPPVALGPGVAKTLVECLRFSLEEPLRRRPRVHHSTCVMNGFVDRKIEPQLARLWARRDAKDACRRLLQSILIFAGMWALVAVERYLASSVSTDGLGVLTNWVRSTTTSTSPVSEAPVSRWVFMPIVLFGILIAYTTFMCLGMSRLPANALRLNAMVTPLFPTALTISAAAATDGVLTFVMYSHTLRQSCSRLVLLIALLVDALIDSMPMTLIALVHMLWRLHVAGSTRGRGFLHYGLLVLLLALAIIPGIAARIPRPLAMGYLAGFPHFAMQSQCWLAVILYTSLLLHVLAKALSDLYAVTAEPGYSSLEAVTPTFTAIVGLGIIFTAACARQEIYSRQLASVRRTLLECLGSPTDCTQKPNVFVDVIFVFGLMAMVTAGEVVHWALAQGFFSLVLSALRCGIYHWLKK